MHFSQFIFERRDFRIRWARVCGCSEIVQVKIMNTPTIFIVQTVEGYHAAESLDTGGEQQPWDGAKATDDAVGCCCKGE